MFDLEAIFVPIVFHMGLTYFVTTKRKEEIAIVRKAF
jgi:hypothetical protein